MEYCKECGHKVSEDDKFCLECGTPTQQEQVKESNTVCLHCGEDLKEDNAFCPECGKSRDETVAVPVTSTSKDGEDLNSSNVEPIPTQEAPTSPEPKKKMAMWKKILLITSIVLIVLAIGAYKFAENHFDPLKDLVKMDEAIVSDDIDGFMSFIDVDKKVPFDKEAFFSYIKDQEWDDGLKDNYYNLIEAEKENPTKMSKELLSVYGEPIFKVKDKKILFGLFTGYTLQAVPMKVSAISNLDNTEVNILDETITLEEADEYVDVGTFYPGTYEVEATTKTDYGDFVVKDNYTIDAEEFSELHIDYDYAMFSIDIDYEFDDAILFIDGESTKKKISDIDEIGPIPLDNKVKIHAEWKDNKDKVVRSNTVKLDDEQSHYVYLEFDERIALDDDVDETEHEVAEFVLDFRMAYENAVNYADYDDIASFMKPGSDEEKDLKKFIKDMDNASYYYDFEENTITNAKKKDDNKFEVETNEQFIFHDEDGSVYEYDRDKVYFIELIDDDYKIYNIDYKDTKKNKIN